MVDGVVRSRRQGVARAVARKARAGGWTVARQQRFLAELAVTANVRASARAVKLSESGAYQLRKSDPAFREAWAAALADGYAKLELTLLERALKGTIRTVTLSSGRQSRTREYSERLALALLAHHAKSVGEERTRHGAGDEPGAGGDPVAQLLETLDAMRARVTAAAGGAEGAPPVDGSDD